MPRRSLCSTISLAWLDDESPSELKTTVLVQDSIEMWTVEFHGCRIFGSGMSGSARLTST